MVKKEKNQMKSFNSHLQKIIEEINSLRIYLIEEEEDNSFEEGILANTEYSLTKLLNKEKKIK